jgi:DNA-binding beta-propeller fold protein YncE
MHILPDLSYLEKKYVDQPFTVVGVHSAKFDNEKDSSAIRSAVLRYDVTHPVVNDGDMIMWRDLGVSSWPTLMVLSPKGKVIAQLAGEGHRKDLDDLVQAALNYYGEKQSLDYRPVPVALEKNKDARLAASPLKFPGKLATDLANQRLFISDSNNHRIVVTDLDGNFILQVGGGGGEGFRDGSFEYAAFNRPQGLTYNPTKNVLYVADTENHAVREIDFVNESVKTLAGNGEKGSDYKGGKKGLAQVLNSPWDVCLDSNYGVLYVALAGQHQIWQINLSDGIARVFSGDGYERNLNGKNGSSSSYAQPSGLSLGSDSKDILIADSESSSVRSMDLKTGGSRILAGGDPLFAENLFKFGDKDGPGSKALLQHPLGVLNGADGLIYIADSYNHKVKVMEKGSQKVTSIAGTGKAGFKDGKGLSAQLSEPAGLAQGPNGTLYVADTNNSLIRVLDVSAKGTPTIKTLELKGIPAPSASPVTAPRRLRRRLSPDTEIVKVAPISSTSGDLQLEIKLPSEFHFTTEAQSKFEADVEQDSGVSIVPASGNIGPDGRAKLQFSRIPGSSNSGNTRISCKVYYCQEDAVCLYKALSFEVPFTAEQEEIPQSVSISYLVQPKSSTRNSLAGVN